MFRKPLLNIAKKTLVPFSSGKVFISTHTNVLTPPQAHERNITRTAVIAAKQGIGALEMEFRMLVCDLFTFLDNTATKQPELTCKIRVFMLAVPTCLTKRHQHASFFEAHTDDIASATTVANFQVIICNYCNYLNVSLFEELVKEFGDKNLKSRLENYMEHLCNFQESTKIVDFIDAQSASSVLPPEFMEVEMILGDSWKDYTLKHVADFHHDTCKKASLAKYAVYFKEGKWSSIVLVYGVARSAVYFLSLVLDEAGMTKHELRAVNFFDVPKMLPTPYTEVVEGKYPTDTGQDGRVAADQDAMKSKHSDTTDILYMLHLAHQEMSNLIIKVSLTPQVQESKSQSQQLVSPVVVSTDWVKHLQATFFTTNL